jgi:pimeloyl-ACP methyl ester carboxylesterase
VSEHETTLKGTVEANGARLPYEIAGSGDPLVLVHAGVADRRMWDGQIAAFTGHYSTVRYDLRGFGESVAAPGPFAHHDDLRSLLDGLGIARAHLVGLSLGGTTVLDFAIAYPERVAGLVVVAASPSGAPASEQLRADWRAIEPLLDAGDVAGAIAYELRMWVDGPGRPEGSAAPAVRELVRQMEEVAFARYETDPPMEERKLEPPAVDRLAEVRCPTLLIVGDQDYPEKVEHARRMAAEIPDARLEIVPNVAHMVNLEAATRFNALVFAFLGSVIA